MIKIDEMSVRDLINYKMSLPSGMIIMSLRKYMTSSNALKCVVSDYENGSPEQKIGNFTQTKIGDFS